MGVALVVVVVVGAEVGGVTEEGAELAILEGRLASSAPMVMGEGLGSD